MNANGPIARELIQFVIDELGRNENYEIADGARVIRDMSTQVTFVPDEGDRPMLIIWMREHWSYSRITARRSLAEIAEIVGEYTDHILGVQAAPAIVIGRVNCYRRKPAIP